MTKQCAQSMKYVILTQDLNEIFLKLIMEVKKLYGSHIQAENLDRILRNQMLVL